eukprot:422686-Pyramimonas_sp.AAC.1
MELVLLHARDAPDVGQRLGDLCDVQACLHPGNERLGGTVDLGKGLPILVRAQALHDLSEAPAL